MNRREVWKRLLWKEVREDRWPLGIAFIAMTAMYSWAGLYSIRDTSLAQTLAFLASGSVHLTIAIWGATKGDSRRSVKEFEFTHLPTDPRQTWQVSVGVATLAAAVLGLWFGYLVQVSTSLGTTIPMPIVGALDLALTYAVCYFAASLASLWAGVLIGMAQLLGGTLIPVWQTSVTTDPYTLAFAARTLAAALVGALVLAALCKKYSQAAHKGAAIAAALLIIYGPSVVGLPGWLKAFGGPSYRESASKYAFRATDYATRDNAIDVAESRRHPANYDCGERSISVTDYSRNVKDLTVSLHRHVEIIGALRDGRVFLAQQKLGSRTISIIEWNYVSRQVRTLARFVTRKDALAARGEPTSPSFSLLPRIQGGYYGMRNVSEDGRYVLLEVGGVIGPGRDTWAVDLKTGRSNVAFVSAAAPVSVVWKKNRVLIGTTDGVDQIDLRTLRGSPFTIPNSQEAAR